MIFKKYAFEMFVFKYKKPFSKNLMAFITIIITRAEFLLKAV